MFQSSEKHFNKRRLFRVWILPGSCSWLAATNTLTGAHSKYSGTCWNYGFHIHEHVWITFHYTHTHCIQGSTACKKFSTPCCTPVVWKLVWPRLARGTLWWQWVLRGAAALGLKSRELRTAPPALMTPLQLEGFSPGSRLCSSVLRPACTKYIRKRIGRMTEKCSSFKTIRIEFVQIISHTWLKESKQTLLSSRNCRVSWTICVSPKAILTATLPFDSWNEQRLQVKPKKAFISGNTKSGRSHGPELGFLLCCIFRQSRQPLHWYPKIKCSSYGN